MNRDLVKAIRLSMVFGFVGAVAIPFAFEVYANLGAVFGWALVLALVVVASIKFSTLELKSSLIGFITMMVFMLGLGIISYMIIHPAVKSYLTNNSKYFYVEPAKTFLFFVRASLMMIVIPLVSITKCGISYALKKIRTNSEATKNYIDNAFKDDVKK